MKILKIIGKVLFIAISVVAVVIVLIWGLLPATLFYAAIPFLILFSIIFVFFSVIYSHLSTSEILGKTFRVVSIFALALFIFTAFLLRSIVTAPGF